MSFQVKRNGALLHLAGEMTIYCAAAMKDRALDDLDCTQDVLLDLSKVSEIDTAGVQILLAAKRCAGAAGRAFAILAPSAAVQEVLGLCRLGDLVQPANQGAV